MIKHVTVTMTALLALALGAGAAVACIDVELAFDPVEAAVGEPVRFFASVANLGDEPIVADLELSIAADGIEIGPIRGQLPLAAGEELARELMFVALFPGQLSITLTATAGDCSDTATATLTITGSGAATPDGLRRLGEDILKSMGATLPVPNGEVSWSSMKNRYR